MAGWRHKTYDVFFTRIQTWQKFIITKVYVFLFLIPAITHLRCLLYNSEMWFTVSSSKTYNFCFFFHINVLNLILNCAWYANFTFLCSQYVHWYLNIWQLHWYINMIGVGSTLSKINQSKEKSLPSTTTYKSKTNSAEGQFAEMTSPTPTSSKSSTWLCLALILILYLYSCAIVISEDHRQLHITDRVQTISVNSFISKIGTSVSNISFSK